MPETYSPPEMPPFPTNYDGLMKTLAPYYQEQRPLDFFFEMYIVDVIEELPDDTKTALTEFCFRHPKLFEKHAGDWRKYVKQEFHLSDTIDVAIWDLWIRNARNAQSDGWQYHPWHYVQNFAENYFADDSRVDVWEASALEDARRRIADHRKNAK